MARITALHRKLCDFFSRKHRRIILLIISPLRRRNGEYYVTDVYKRQVVEQNDADRDRIHGALEHILNAGYLYQKPRRMNRRRVIKVMAADWDRLAEDEIYRRERTSD